MDFKVISLAALASLVCGCGSAGNVKDAAKVPQMLQLNSYLFSVNESGDISTSGYADFDQYQNGAGVNGAIYPGYNGAVFLASVLTHAVMSKSADSSRMKNFIEQSDKAALARCEGSYLKLSATEYKNQVIAMDNDRGQTSKWSLIDAHAADEQPLGTITSKPSIILTSANNGLVIENKFIVNSNNKVKPKKRRNTRSDRKAGNQGEEYNVVIIRNNIDSNTGKTQQYECDSISQVSQALLQDSVSLFRESFSSSLKVSTNYKTIRYNIGDHYRVERGQIIKSDCEAVIFKSLRGWIKSVPSSVPCDKAVASKPI